jgi:hypothetical protein
MQVVGSRLNNNNKKKKNNCEVYAFEFSNPNFEKHVKRRCNVVREVLLRGFKYST